MSSTHILPKHHCVQHFFGQLSLTKCFFTSSINNTNARNTYNSLHARMGGGGHLKTMCIIHIVFLHFAKNVVYQSTVKKLLQLLMFMSGISKTTVHFYPYIWFIKTKDTGVTFPSLQQKRVLVASVCDGRRVKWREPTCHPHSNFPLLCSETESLPLISF